MHAAYLDEIASLAQRSAIGHLITHFDDEAGGKPLDIQSLLASVPEQAHLYCCGPAAMLTAYEKATVGRPSGHVHLERFATAKADTASPGAAFQVVLARSNKALSVPAEKSILDVLLDNGIDAPYGCMQGVCGMCEVPVLDGTPDHRDQILTNETRTRNASLIVCCSRSLTPSLTIDL